MEDTQKIFYSCQVCGRPLTSRKSMLRGYGPICYSRINPKRITMENALSDDPIIVAPDFLEQVSDAVCDCGIHLGDHIPFHGYEHEGGQFVESEDKTLWLYKVCPKCQYQWAFWKLQNLHKSQQKTDGLF